MYHQTTSISGRLLTEQLKDIPNKQDTLIRGVYKITWKPLTNLGEFRGEFSLSYKDRVIFMCRTIDTMVRKTDELWGYSPYKFIWAEEAKTIDPTDLKTMVTNLTLGSPIDRLVCPPYTLIYTPGLKPFYRLYFYTHLLELTTDVKSIIDSMKDNVGPASEWLLQPYRSPDILTFLSSSFTDKYQEQVEEDLLEELKQLLTKEIPLIAQKVGNLYPELPLSYLEELATSFIAFYHR